MRVETCAHHATSRAITTTIDSEFRFLAQAGCDGIDTVRLPYRCTQDGQQ